MIVSPAKRPPARTPRLAALAALLLSCRTAPARAAAPAAGAKPAAGAAAAKPAAPAKK